MSASETPERAEDFSPFLGGPLYQLLLRLGLIKPPLDRVKGRAFVVVMIVWAPLLVLTALDGRLLGGAKIPFLHDFEVQARLLAAIPLLIVAEVTIHGRVRAMVRQFLERQIVTGPLEIRLEKIVESATRLRNSMAIEIALVAAVLVIGRLSWEQLSGVQSDTWYATAAAGVRSITRAGFWYRFVSVPISQFILLRWFFRLGIWWRLLFQISRLDLNLVPTHPDQSCGLGFLGAIVSAMGPFLLALSCLLSGSLANRILWEGSRLPDHYVEIGVMAAFLCAIALGPLCVFTPALLRAKREGLNRYGKLASDYVNDFDRKWIGGERPAGEPLMGTADIQSLADLGNSFQIVRGVVPFPFGRNALVGLVVVVALPLLPLLLTMFSLQEMVLRLVKIVL